MSASTQGATRRTTKPDKYDGKSDWADYLRHFEMVSSWNAWTAEEKAAQLALNLTGIARQAWSDSAASEHPNYETLVAVMGQRFRPEGQEEAFKAEFRTRNKTKEESYLDFGHVLRRLAV